MTPLIKTAAAFAAATIATLATAASSTVQQDERIAKMGETDFCTKELRKLKGKKSPLPQPWFDSVASRARDSGVDGGHLVQIQEGRVVVGMTACGAIAAWGRPQDINKTTTARGTREQWVYGGRNYLYFTDGRLDAIQN